MAGAFISEGKMLPVMFVRHGQSTNNPIYEGLYAQQFAGEITAVRNDTVRYVLVKYILLSLRRKSEKSLRKVPNYSMFADVQSLHVSRHRLLVLPAIVLQVEREERCT